MMRFHSRKWKLYCLWLLCLIVAMLYLQISCIFHQTKQTPCMVNDAMMENGNVETNNKPNVSSGLLNATHRLDIILKDIRKNGNNKDSISKLDEILSENRLIFSGIRENQSSRTEQQDIMFYKKIVSNIYNGTKGLNKYRVKNAVHNMLTGALNKDPSDNITGEYRNKWQMLNNIQTQHDHPMKLLTFPSINPCRNDTSVAVFVLSTVNNTQERYGIRTTWGSVAKSNTWPPERKLNRKISIVFVTAKSRDSKIDNNNIQLEASKHGDIIHGDFIDDYRNLTLKSILVLKYASLYCKHVPYLVKSDDDMFVDVPHLLTLLFGNNVSTASNTTVFNRSMIGACIDTPYVVRTGKWNTPFGLYPFNRYPKYLSGTLYVISMDIVPELQTLSTFIPLIQIEDVYVTGILGKVVNATHICKNYQFSYFTEPLPTICDVAYHKKIAYTKFTVKCMKLTWFKLKRGLCSSNPMNI